MTGASQTRRLLLALAVVVLYLLHNDWWLWDDPSRAFGLPAGLAYHLGYCFVAAALMALAVRWLGLGALDAVDPVDSPSAGKSGEAR